MVKKTILLVWILFMLSDVSGMSGSFEAVDSLKVYPNPATTTITIDFYSDDLPIPKLRVLDLTGKVVIREDKKFTVEAGKFQAEINISELNPGIYFLKVIQGEAVFTRRLIVR